jgi:hypothetical protein
MWHATEGVSKACERKEGLMQSMFASVAGPGDKGKPGCISRAASD